jgi:hypothetical protein
MRFYLTLIFFLFFAALIKAQPNNDAGMWTTLSISHPFTKKLSLAIDQELRIKENYQRINLFYTNLGVDYKLNKYIKISPTYRAIQKKKLEGYYSFRHRFMLDVTVKKKFNKFTLSERFRYQAEVQDFNTSRKGHLPEQFLRLKTDLKYNLNDKVTPFVSCELRYQIRSVRGDGPLYDGGFHRIRNVAGLDYQLDRRSTFTVYYLVQTEFNISTPENIFILGLAYSITL